MSALSLLPPAPPPSEQAVPETLLDGVVEAQLLNSDLLGPRIGATADQLMRLVAELSRHGRPPLLMPVSGPGERLTGAALALARGTLAAADYTRSLTGLRLLLVDGAVTGTVRLAEHARLLRGLGADVDHAAVVRVLAPAGPGIPKIHQLAPH